MKTCWINLICQLQHFPKFSSNERRRYGSSFVDANYFTSWMQLCPGTDGWSLVLLSTFYSLGNNGSHLEKKELKQGSTSRDRNSFVCCSSGVLTHYCFVMRYIFPLDQMTCQRPANSLCGNSKLQKEYIRMIICYTEVTERVI